MNQVGNDVPGTDAGNRRRRQESPGNAEKAKKLAWSKILMVIMIALCGEIIIYTEVIMWITWDTSSLYALVGVAASLAASIWAYCEKSKAENTKGGITYDVAMKGPGPGEDGMYG